MSRKNFSKKINLTGIIIAVAGIILSLAEIIMSAKWGLDLHNIVYGLILLCACSAALIINLVNFRK